MPLVFGVPLVELLQRERERFPHLRVPLVVYCALDFLSRGGTKEDRGAKKRDEARGKREDGRGRGRRIAKRNLLMWGR
jgi:hypothetical protein